MPGRLKGSEIGVVVRRRAQAQPLSRHAVGGRTGGGRSKGTLPMLPICHPGHFDHAAVQSAPPRMSIEVTMRLVAKA
eukprot:scaffold133339_cov52-Phaeocystis_antarctica.AAC.1